MYHAHPGRGDADPVAVTTLGRDEVAHEGARVHRVDLRAIEIGVVGEDLCPKHLGVEVRTLHTIQQSGADQADGLRQVRLCAEQLGQIPVMHQLTRVLQQRAERLCGTRLEGEHTPVERDTAARRVPANDKGRVRDQRRG